MNKYLDLGWLNLPLVNYRMINLDGDPLEIIIPSVMTYLGEEIKIDNPIIIDMKGPKTVFKIVSFSENTQGPLEISIKFNPIRISIRTVACSSNISKVFVRVHYKTHEIVNIPTENYKCEILNGKYVITNMEWLTLPIMNSKSALKNQRLIGLTILAARTINNEVIKLRNPIVLDNEILGTDGFIKLSTIESTHDQILIDVNTKTSCINIRDTLVLPNIDSLLIKTSMMIESDTNIETYGLSCDDDSIRKFLEQDNTLCNIGNTTTMTKGERFRQTHQKKPDKSVKKDYPVDGYFDTSNEIISLKDIYQPISNIGLQDIPDSVVIDAIMLDDDTKILLDKVVNVKTCPTTIRKLEGHKILDDGSISSTKCLLTAIDFTVLITPFNNMLFINHTTNIIKKCHFYIASHMIGIEKLKKATEDVYDALCNKDTVIKLDSENIDGYSILIDAIDAAIERYKDHFGSIAIPGYYYKMKYLIKNNWCKEEDCLDVSNISTSEYFHILSRFISLVSFDMCIYHEGILGWVLPIKIFRRYVYSEVNTFNNTLL